MPRTTKIRQFFVTDLGYTFNTMIQDYCSSISVRVLLKYPILDGLRLLPEVVLSQKQNSNEPVMKSFFFFNTQPLLQDTVQSPPT